MQSIYQFREAEVGLFLRARDHGIGSLRLQRLHLTRNFRSVAPAHHGGPIRVSSTCWPRSDDVRTSAVAFTPSLAERAAGTHPRSSYPCMPQAIARPKPLPSRRGSLRYETRRRTRLSPCSSARAPMRGPISAALAAAHRRLVGVKIVPLAGLSVIRDLVALTRALHHLADRAAWPVVLRAPWCGANPATLAELSQKNDPLLIWESARRRGAPHRAARQTKRARLARVRAFAGARARGTRPRAARRVARVDLVAARRLRRLRLQAAQSRAPFLQAVAERAASGNWRGPQDLDALMKELYGEAHSASANRDADHDDSPREGPRVRPCVRAGARTGFKSRQRAPDALARSAEGLG